MNCSSSDLRSPSRPSPGTWSGGGVTTRPVRVGLPFCATMHRRSPPWTCLWCRRIGFDLLYALIIVRLARRELVWVNVTAHPTAEWIARQITEAFPWNEAPRYLIRDRDGIYGTVVRRRLRAMGIRDKPIAAGSPWQNCFAERLIGSIRRECVDHLVVLGEQHLRRVLRSYALYYNETRTHRSLNKDAPVPRPIQRIGRIASRCARRRAASPIRPNLSFRYTTIVCTPTSDFDRSGVAIDTDVFNGAKSSSRAAEPRAAPLGGPRGHRKRRHRERHRRDRPSCSRFACGSGPVVHHQMAERTQIQLQAVTHMFFSQAVPVQRSRSARLRLENARRS